MCIEDKIQGSKMNEKRVRFAAEITTHTFPRPDASDIQSLYYQVDDYRRFKEDKWLEEIRNERKQVKIGHRASRRDSLTLIRSRSGYSYAPIGFESCEAAAKGA